jgi:ABC-type multidrug transport system permease subunit
MLKRILAIFKARNLEFLRDRGTLSWNIILPVALMFGLSFIFSSDRAEYTVGVLQAEEMVDTSSHPFLESRYIEFVPVTDQESGFRRVARHQLDLLVEFGDAPTYWINPDSPKGYFVEFALRQADEESGGNIEKASIEGDPVRYVDWVLPGILGMNVMFSSLFGVGYVVVRYRKNGFLKRLRATPLRAIEFVIAQVASRLVLILIITSFVYAGTKFFLDTRMDGNHINLLIVLLTGSIAMISMGLMVAARVTSEELAGGMLNMVTWPMMMLSGVWFSLEAASDWVRGVAAIFPLTHMLDAARAVMLDGAGLGQIAPELTMLLGMSAVFLMIGAATFRWHPK